MPSAVTEREFYLDTNAYLRLAEVLHPLLKLTFGQPQARLRTIPDVHDEFKRSVRLQTHFSWAMGQKFYEDRKASFPRISVATRKQIVSERDYLLDDARWRALPVSQTDMFVLAYGLVMKQVVVSDDRGMKTIADDYGIAMIGVADFLALLYDEGGITIEKIKDVVDVMELRHDVPNRSYFYFTLGELYKMAEMKANAKNGIDR